MTSFLIMGYFALGNGRRVASENPTTKKSTSHVYYDTVVQTAGVDIPAEIRVWMPATEAILPDNTVVDIIGKVYAPPNEPALIDVLSLTSFPGDPESPAYEDNIPERPFPTVFMTGHVASAPDTLEDNVSVGYFVTATEYVRDQARVSRVFCRFDGSKPRWKKTPRPQAGSAVQIMGLAWGQNITTGQLVVDTDQVTLNVGTAPATSGVVRHESGGNGDTATKKHRFTAVKATGGSSGSGVRFAEEATLPLPGLGESSGSTASTATSSASSSARGKRGGKRKAAARTFEDDD